MWYLRGETMSLMKVPGAEITCTPVNRVISLVLLRLGVRPVFLRDLASEEQSQVSHYC